MGNPRKSSTNGAKLESGSLHQNGLPGGDRVSQQLTIDRIQQQRDLGLHHYKSGRLPEAEACFLQVLQTQPHNPNLWRLLGTIALQQQHHSAAIERLNRAIELDPEAPNSHSTLGTVYASLQRWPEAIQCFQTTIQHQPSDASTYAKLGGAYQMQGQTEEAIAAYQQALNLQPDLSPVHTNLGQLYQAQEKCEEAIASYRQALHLQPNSHHIHIAIGQICQQTGDLDEAVASYQRVLQLQPNLSSVHAKLGQLYQAQENLDEAIASYQRALELQPDFFEVLNNLGNVLKPQGKFEEALDSYHRALKLQPEDGETLNNLGTVYQALGNLDEAIASYQRALQLQPDFYQAHSNLGNAFKDRGQLDEAIASYQRALQLQPDFQPAHYNLGNAYQEEGNLPEAIASYHRALQLQPDCPQVLNEYVWMRRGICSWDGLSALEDSLMEASRTTRWAAPPLPMLAIDDDPAVQLTAAKNFCANAIGNSCSPLWTGERYRHDKIRLAYLSADYREHPVARVMAELFERHDRSRFEVVAISFGPKDSGPMGQRMVRAFDRFIDVREMSHREAAQLLRELEIDIAIDLAGYTRHCRPQILAHRPAPIQVSYVGYPATTGTDVIDYILADPFVAPTDRQPYFTEKLVHLPDCYLGHDSTQAIGDRTPSRAECGLPDDGFVFCSFNNSYKISPALFDVWMRLLDAVPGSVLWLKQGYPAAADNLRQETASRGIDPDRLVFASRMDELSDHLARHRLADVFLDSFPYNAHSTASDALWAGLPVLTCAGRSFASRVAGSLLYSIGLPELVTHSLAEYEALALNLATQPDVLDEIHRKLARNRLGMPLFDSDRLRRNVEAAYQQMWSLWQQGERPRTFAVSPSPDPSQSPQDLPHKQDTVKRN